jgi:prevent-host-death family protein
MKQAGIREARQNLTALIDEVRKGHEVTITDRGRPVARLVPPRSERAAPFAGRADFRKRMSGLSTSLAEVIMEERTERG